MFKSKGQLRDVIVAVSPSEMANVKSETELEIVTATEDDLEDDCPLCQMLRQRIRNGEQIDVVKLKAKPIALH